MASNEHRRQKKLAKKNRRDKEVRKAVVELKNRSTREILAETTRTPWVECRLKEKAGMCQVFGLRRSPLGELIMVALLVDKYCLGVKHVEITRDVDWDQYRVWVDGLPGSVRTTKPSYALKMIQGAIEYGHANGFSPHRDTATALSMFADVDSAECSDEIHFGRNGRPLYSNGPYEDAARIKAVIATLDETRGQGNYDVLIQRDASGWARFDNAQESTLATHIPDELDGTSQNDPDENGETVLGDVIHSSEVR